MTDEERKEVAGILSEVRELLSDKSRWTKGSYARDKDGQPVGVRSRKAVCWCLEGAIRKVLERYKNNDHYAAYFTLTCKAFMDATGTPDVHIADWNDRHIRTWRFTLTTLDDAIRRIKETRQ